MSRFKTELCNNLIELGVCKYGDRCHYAHGAHELRQVSRRHPKYRTEKCKNFELTGKCPFGPRCSYVHPKPDLDSMIEQLSKYMKHTKAPKPDSEDDDDVSLAFTRTNTSISTCDSLIVNDDENKENQHNIVLNHENATRNSNLENIHPHHHLHFIDHSSTLTKDTLLLRKRLDSSSSSSSSPVSATPILSNNTNVSSRAASTSTARTPLANSSNNYSNTLTPMNLTNYNTSTTIRQANDQINGTKTSKFGTIGSKNFSFFEVTSYENNKKLRLNNTEPSNVNNTASNPFGISNPLSDYLNISNINGRSPLNPNKQYYTRF